MESWSTASRFALPFQSATGRFSPAGRTPTFRNASRTRVLMDFPLDLERLRSLRSSPSVNGI